VTLAGLRGRMARVEASALFHHLTVGVIVFAAVLIGLETIPGLAARHQAIFAALDRSILLYFLAEIALRVAARGRSFFKEGWNWFDLTVVAVCMLPAGTGYLAAIRLLRVLRILRLLTAVPKLQILVTALLKSLPSMGYVVLLLAILFYIYAVVGVKLFGSVDPAHFGSLAQAFVTLFQVVTLEGWADLMWAHRPVSDPTAVPWGAAFYFVTFILTGTMITLNLLIGVIINSMQESHKEIHIAAVASKPDAPDTRSRLENIEMQLVRIQEHLDAIRYNMGGNRSS
jgi:voltage-gated sodium channel